MQTRDEQGHWQKGIPSPNPQGRPKSPKGELRRALAANGIAIVNNVVEAALAGDMAACKMLLDRISPVEESRK